MLGFFDACMFIGVPVIQSVSSDDAGTCWLVYWYADIIHGPDLFIVYACGLALHCYTVEFNDFGAHTLLWCLS